MDPLERNGLWTIMIHFNDHQLLFDSTPERRGDLSNTLCFCVYLWYHENELKGTSNDASACRHYDAARRVHLI